MDKTNYTSSASSEFSSEFSPSSVRRRRQVQGSACDDCRRRKARCDGQRPGPCERNDVPCHYETFVGETRTAARSRRTDDLVQENESLRLENDELRRRLGFDVGASDSLMSTSISSASSPPEMPLSLHSANQGFLPSWLTSTEYELMLSHPNSYPFDQLPDLTTLTSLHAKRIRRMLGDVHFTPEGSESLPGKGKAAHRAQDREEAPQRSEQSLRHELLWQRPQSGSAPSHADPRLEHANIEAWCPSVAIPNDLARRLIGFYLEMDHAVLGHFDADLFVEDLLHFRSEFCSQLLVNSLLLWACHGYSAYDQRALALKDAFLTETARLWEGQRGVDSVLAVAAGIFLKMACVCNGNEEFGRSIVIEIYEMAHRLDLFGTVDDTPAYTHGNSDSNTQRIRARAHAAWGAFNFVTLNAFSYGDPVMHKPPRFVIPGDINTWQLPDYMVAVLYYAEPRRGSISERTSLDFAQKTYSRLLEWADTHGPLIRNWAGDSHYQCYLHTVFHAAVLDIFRPFLGLSLPLQSTGEQQHTPESIFIASARQINYQVLIYPVIHPSTTFIFWFTAVVQSANAAMTKLQDQQSQQMFLVCLIALHDLSPCFPIMSTALMGLISIVTRKGDITETTARHLHDRLCRQSGKPERSSEASGAFVIDLAAAVQELASLTAGQLVQRFEGIMLSEPSV